MTHEMSDAIVGLLKALTRLVNVGVAVGEYALEEERERTKRAADMRGRAR